MAMHKRDLDLQHVETPPRFVEAHPVRFVLLVYLAVVALAAVFFQILGHAQNNPNDVRNVQAPLIFAVVMMFPFGWALFHAYRRPKLPRFSRR